VGLLAVGGNWWVARVLRPWAEGNAAIRLAYLHNRGDVYVSLVPVTAGLLVSVSGRPVFDALAAIVVGTWVIGTTVIELRRSADDLLWPEDAVCPHEEKAKAA
jgi:cobalt-zinc-cadmium efflux system protein